MWRQAPHQLPPHHRPGANEITEELGKITMTTERRDDLKAFHDFVEEQLANGGASLTPAETLELWEIQHPSDEEQAATVEALREALDDMRAGDTGVPVREFLADLRRKYHLSMRS
jgi:hypothetical protein